VQLALSRCTWIERERAFELCLGLPELALPEKDLPELIAGANSPGRFNRTRPQA